MIQNIDLQNYSNILIIAGLAIGLSTVIICIPFFFRKVRWYSSKVSAYECGFNAFSSPRAQFDVRFYLVAILFIIFDLEVAFLFPWAVVVKSIGFSAYWAMMLFFSILIVGFIYEWKKGSLEWR